MLKYSPWGCRLQADYNQDALAQSASAKLCITIRVLHYRSC